MPFQEKKRKRKRKKKTKKLWSTPESNPIHSLPDDLLISCLARVSRLYYPSLLLVSKRFRSLINSPELYATRSSLGNIENCVYVCIRSTPHTNPRWFTLCLKPNRNLINKKSKKKKESKGYVLAPISVQYSPPAHRYGLVSIGSNIYNIDGHINKEPSPSVSILDCRFHTWSKAPNMNVDRYYPHATVLGGKIYVTGGGTRDRTNSNLIEVFDPKTQTWELVISPICKSSIQKTAAVDGKVYIIGFNGENSFSYEPREGKWETVGTYIEFSRFWPYYPHCVIENTVYCYSSGEMFLWYNFEVRQWRYVRGLKRLPEFAPFTRVRLANYGGKLVVFWYLDGDKEKEKIWCAVIELKKRRGGKEIWGKVEWLDLVLTVHVSEFLCAITATV